MFFLFLFYSERCDEVLASPLPYSAFTSSSVLAADFGAGYAKLNRRVGEEERNEYYKHLCSKVWGKKSHAQHNKAALFCQYYYCFKQLFSMRYRPIYFKM